jgi:superfamily II DNA/RNA helicase|uniref:RNA helicase n=1 Tax=viral metagenome TaxID=1070528 RepID=A0A6C0EFS6_9ZZZZ
MTEQDNKCESTDSFSEIRSWDELEISSDLLRGIYGYGFERPSPIQCKAITPIIKGKDIIAQAQSGTGKTAAFSVGALSLVDLSKMETQILIMSPTRELTKQISLVISSLGTMMNGLSVYTLVGGTSIDEDANKLKNTPPHVIVGCPGRVYDMIRRGNIKAKNIKLVVLDEADEMLSSGFKEQVYNIFQTFSNDIQVALFSATLPEYINNITSKFMRDPVNIFVKTEALTLEGISQYFVAVDDDKQKYLAMKDLYSYISLSQCIIYCNSIKRVVDLHDAMIEDGFPVCCIHSNMDKSARDVAFADFRNGKYRVMISSNVTARGIDIQQISVVINFDIPKCVHTYLHRIGRSGRWGRKGVGINFITRRDVSKLKEIEQHYDTQITELPGNFEQLFK